MRQGWCNQETVTLHQLEVQSVVACNCDLLKGALAGGTDMFLLLWQLNFCPCSYGSVTVTTISRCCLT